MNQFNIDFDYPGLCALCHTEVAEFNGSREVVKGHFRPIIERFKNNMRTVVVKLSNGSMMTVILCDKCADIKPEDMGPLMDSVIDGWQYEVDTLLPHWDDDKKKSHMKHAYSLEAIDKIDRSFSEDEKKRITKHKKENIKVEKEKSK